MDKRIYYSAAGYPVGPLPSDGEWPSKYASRGLSLEPPENAPEPPEPSLGRATMKELRELGNQYGVRTVGVHRDVIIEQLERAIAAERELESATA